MGHTLFRKIMLVELFRSRCSDLMVHWIEGSPAAEFPNESDGWELKDNLYAKDSPQGFTGAKPIAFLKTRDFIAIVCLHTKCCPIAPLKSIFI